VVLFHPHNTNECHDGSDDRCKTLGSCLRNNSQNDADANRNPRDD
jgi:hypothetical protein